MRRPLAISIVDPMSRFTQLVALLDEFGAMIFVGFAYLCSDFLLIL